MTQDVGDEQATNVDEAPSVEDLTQDIGDEQATNVYEASSDENGHDEVQQQNGFEENDDDVHVDADAVDIGILALLGKGKKML